MNFPQAVTMQGLGSRSTYGVPPFYVSNFGSAYAVANPPSVGGIIGPEVPPFYIPPPVYASPFYDNRGGGPRTGGRLEPVGVRFFGTGPMGEPIGPAPIRADFFGTPYVGSYAPPTATTVPVSDPRYRLYPSAWSAYTPPFYAAAGSPGLAVRAAGQPGDIDPDVLNARPGDAGYVDPNAGWVTTPGTPPRPTADNTAAIAGLVAAIFGAGANITTAAIRADSANTIAQINSQTLQAIQQLRNSGQDTTPQGAATLGLLQQLLARTTPPTQDNTALYVVGGVMALALVGGGVYLATRGPRRNPVRGGIKNRHYVSPKKLRKRRNRRNRK